MRWQELSGKRKKIEEKIFVDDSRHRKSNLWRKSQLPRSERKFSLCFYALDCEKRLLHLSEPISIFFALFHFACVSDFVSTRPCMYLQIFVDVGEKIEQIFPRQKKAPLKRAFFLSFPIHCKCPRNFVAPMLVLVSDLIFSLSLWGSVNFYFIFFLGPCSKIALWEQGRKKWTE